MAFSWSRARAVLWKDLVELRKNRGLLASLAALPAVLVLVPTGVVYAYARDPHAPDLRAMASFYDVSIRTSEAAARFLIDKTLADGFGLFLIMPLFVPILISSHAIAGEKERRTLEPLLASPITSIELMVGKSLASLLPAFVITLGAFALLCLFVDLVAWELARAPLLPNAMWLFGVLVIAPLFAFFGNGIAVVISARVGEARLAQQLSGLLVLPILGLVGAQLAGWLQAGSAYYAAQGGVVLVFDVILLFAGARLFDRDRLVSKWT